MTSAVTSSGNDVFAVGLAHQVTASEAAVLRSCGGGGSQYSWTLCVSAASTPPAGVEMSFQVAASVYGQLTGDLTKIYPAPDKKSANPGLVCNAQACRTGCARTNDAGAPGVSNKLQTLSRSMVARFRRCDPISGLLLLVSQSSKPLCSLRF